VTLPFQSETEPAVAQDPRRDLVERIIASPAFVKSPRLRSILLFICDLSLNGRNEEINELNIGAAVFGRAHNYDRSVDGIVRSHVSRLRHRLEQYFSEEGTGEPIRLSIPKGGYIPVFEQPQPPWAAHTLEPLAVQPSSPAQQISAAPGEHPQRRLVLGLTLALLCACACILYLLLFPPRAATPQSLLARHPFWKNFFSVTHPTLVVCSDTGLTILENLTGVNVSLADYLSGDYRTRLATPLGTTPETARIMAQHRYTSIVDAEIVSRLYHLAGPAAGTLQIRYSRDLRPNDLKNGSVILLGTQEGNPWVELFIDRMNFRLLHNHVWDSFSILDLAPRGRELPRYESSREDPLHRVYGIVAFRPNLSGSGQVLILEGTSMAGTECAADFVFDDTRFLPFLEKIRNPNGSLPYFELLLRSNNMNGNASDSELIGYRTSPD
jgi:hypothetical protein